MKQNKVARDEAVAYQRVMERQEKRRRKNRKKIIMAMFTLSLIILSVLCFTVFFNIETIQVEGTDVYPVELIIEKSEINIGDNLFRMKDKEIKAKMKLALPYVENVTLQRKLPNTLQIQITQAKETGAISQENRFIILSENNRVLRDDVTELPENIRLIKGISPENCVIGNYILIDDKQKSNLLKELYFLLDQKNFTDITLLDIENTEDIRINIGTKREVLLGGKADLAYKIDMLAEVNGKHLDENESVVIDCRNPKRVVVSPKKK